MTSPGSGIAGVHAVADARRRSRHHDVARLPADIVRNNRYQFGNAIHHVGGVARLHHLPIHLELDIERIGIPTSSLVTSHGPGLQGVSAFTFGPL